MRSRALHWAAGIIFGSAAAWLVGSAAGPILAAVVAIPTVAPRPNAAYAGGLLVAVGLWWMYFDRQLSERCEAMGWGPNGGCQIVADPNLPLFALLLAIGAALSVWTIAPRRAAR